MYAVQSVVPFHTLRHHPKRMLSSLRRTRATRDGGGEGRDKVEVKAAKLSPEGKTVALSIPGLQPVMQMEIKLRLRAADGAEIRTMIGNTINKLR